ncbi:MAG: DUF4340 domain-containing protein [Clostridia bacterium]|nr:DUF4340 domain-containing protein [Clostridia bacterium]
MIKRLKPVIILCSILVVLIIAFFVVRHFLPQAVEETVEQVIYLLDEKLIGADGKEAPADSIPDPDDRTGVLLDEADSIKIENDFGSYVLVKRAIGNYYIQGKKELPVNGESVTTLLENIGKLGMVQEVVEKPTDEQLKNYGLKTPVVTVTVDNGVKSFVLKIGIAHENGNYYAQISGDPAVYLIGPTVPDVVMLSKYQFYSDTMIDYTDSTEDLENLTKMMVGGNGREQDITIELNELADDEVGAAYMITEPFGHPFSNMMQDNLTALLSALAKSSVAGDDVSESALASYGLDEPEFFFSFTISGKTQTVYFGKVSDADYRYCYAKGGKFIHSVAESDADVLYAPLKDYCENMIYTNSYDTMEAIKITGKGKTYQITVSEVAEDGEFTATVNNRVVNSDLFSDFYAHVLMIGISDLGGKEGATAPYLTVEMTQRDGDVDIIRFYKVSDDKCFCEINGGGQFWVKIYNVDLILKNAQNLYDGKEINLEY